MSRRTSFPICVGRFLIFLFVVEGICYVVMHLLLGWSLWWLLIPAVLVILVYGVVMEPDLTDVWFRLEKSFAAKLDRSVLGRGRESVDLTAEQLHSRVCDCLRSQGKPVPSSSWHRVQQVLCDATGKPPRLVRRESRLHADLEIT